MMSFAAVVGAALCISSAIATDECQTDSFNMSLLQRQLSLEAKHAIAASARKRTMPPLNLLFRSTYSNDPVESVRWVTRYFGAEALSDTSFATLLPNSVAAAAYVKSSSGINDYKVVFARGEEIDAGMDQYVTTVATEWKTKVLAHESWSHWGDNHDGLLSYPFNLTAARVDGLDYVMTNTVTRFYLPPTAWTFELRSDDLIGYEVNSPADLAYQEEHSWLIEEACRAGDEFLSMHEATDISLWWKTTYAAANASAARQFAMDVLGATDTDCPFPYPPTEVCTGALWLDVSPDSQHSFQLHFVELLDGHEAIVEFHKYHATKVQALKNGCLDPSLYDNVAFEVETLDPFVKKLDSWKTPYLVTESQGRFSLIFAFPGNEAIVLQLQSEVLTSKTPQTLSAC